MALDYTCISFYCYLKKTAEVSTFKKQSISPDCVLAGQFLLSHLGTLLWLHSAGKMAGLWDSAGLSSWAFSGHGNLRAFQEGVGVEVVCTTSHLPHYCKASHKCTPDWRVGELEATTPSGNACAGRGAICGLVCSLPQYIADSNLMCIYPLGKIFFAVGSKNWIYLLTS